MLTKTSISAIRALMFLGENGQGVIQSPRNIAEATAESPTYMAKVTRLLVKTGILRAARGAKGGVELNRAPGDITLQAVVEACQGVIVGDFCSPVRDTRSTCAFHRAAHELQQAIVGVLSRWTLADLLEKPRGAQSSKAGIACLMVGMPSTLHKRRPPAG
jgi:Rrf2 family protein